MAYCILQATDGRIRHVEIGVPYRLEPGEKQIGVVTDGEPTHKLAARPTDYARLRQELDIGVGPGAGDWIKMLAKPLAGLVGKANCSTCEARRIATNAYAQLRAKHGQIQAITIIKELWQLSMTAPGDDVLVKLKGYLDA